MKHWHKTLTAGYNARILSSNTSSILYSFGDGEWENWPNRGARYEVWGVYIEPDRVAYISHFEKKLVFANMEDQTSFWTDIRDLPFNIVPSGVHYNEETNMRYDIAYPLYRSMFIGPFGELNIVFYNLMSNGEMYGPDNHGAHTPVAVLDRFNTNGQYLDSYCLPDSTLNSVYYNGNGYMVAIQSPTGTIFGYRIKPIN